MLLDESTRNKLTDLQYERPDDGTTFDTDSVKTVINQQKGLDLDTQNINIYSSSDEQLGPSGGFDGHALHLYNPDQNINDVYYIFRGTEVQDLHDIVYNAIGIGSGTNTEQLQAAERFFGNVEGKIQDHLEYEEYNNLTRMGDGHSLGGNLVVSLALLTKNFTDVRGLNDAPVNVQHLIDHDQDFSDYLEIKVGDDINDISEDELSRLALDFYSDEAKNISHTRVRGEALYPQSIPDTLFIGNEVHYIGDPDISHFPDMLAKQDITWRDYVLPNGHSPFHKRTHNKGIDRLHNDLGHLGENMTVDDIVNHVENPSLSTLGLAARLGVIGFSDRHEIVSFLLNPYMLSNFSDAASVWDTLHKHSMETFIDYFDNGPHPIQSFHQVIDPVSGERIKLSADVLLIALNHMRKALETKRDAMQKLHNYWETEVPEITSSHRSTVNSLMDDKEASGRAFVTEEHSIGWMENLQPGLQAKGVQFERSFDPLSEAVDSSLEQAMERYQIEINHLDQLQERFSQHMNTLFEADEDVSRQIQMLGG
ncbi:hypothetical protein HUG15_15980 [Salicibibacter cibarius]|uniref:DUF6792 domain-containing protein n=1 Tax=Salicibibacter cibarius TaxID=2743000 RepID=A0A7T7CCF0_9BACI|nr:DUF6792 domain-containing protein [Salicibibacter cibarius]QQK76919.1 hypothetical protein HUG15_15980 [Salicibibacter cibarius]